MIAANIEPYRKWKSSMNLGQEEDRTLAKEERVANEEKYIKKKHRGYRHDECNFWDKRIKHN